MARSSILSPAIILALVLGPAIAIGMTLWFVNDVLPECVVTEHQRVTAPDNRFDLVTFSRNCGATTTGNTQAILVAPGETVSPAADSFVSVDQEADLQPRWDAYGNIELTLPENVAVFRQDDSVAGVGVIYR